MTTAQKILFSGKAYKQHFEFWKSELKQNDGGFVFRQQAPKHDSHVQVLEKQLNQELTQSLLSSVNHDQRGIWVYALSAFGLVFSRYSGESRIVFDTPAIHSEPTQTNELKVPFRMETGSGLSNKDLLRGTKAKFAETYKYQDLPMEAVLDRYSDLKVSENNISLSHQLLHGSNENHTYDLQIDINFENEALTFRFSYDTAVFENFFLEGLWNHFVHILNQLAADEKSLKEFQVVSKEEQELLLAGHTASIDGYSLDTSILGLFNRQVDRDQEAVAVKDSQRALSYKELDDASNKLANHLNNQGIGKGSVVAFALDTTVDVVITIMGIIKSHASFLPIDVNFPENRIKTILEVSKADLLITSSERMFEITYYQGPLMAIDIELPMLPELDHFEMPDITAEDPAYMIFTSGSTGTPKGVVIPHRAIANYINWVLSDFSLDRFSSVLLSSHAFDLCYTAFWGALLSGGGIHLLDESTRKSPKEIIQYLNEQRIKFIKTTPSQFSMLRNAMIQNPEVKLNELALIFLGGEPINFKEVQSYLTEYPATTFVNHYGPTETTVGTIFHVITPENIKAFCDQPVIGKPITNNAVRIVSDGGNLQPLGVWGEICIVGAGVALGYKDRPDLTAEKFHENTWDGNLLMYHTGDRGRWLADGTIELSGRFDDQVKIRGYRVEPNEIAKTISTREDVGEAVVISKKENGETALHGFIVPSENETIITKVLEAEKEIKGTFDGDTKTDLCRLGNGLSIYYPSQEELSRLYKFSDEGYFKLGISLPERPTVIDVGAGSGIFSIPLALQYPGANIIAVEASPFLRAMLKNNLEAYGLQAILPEVALSDQNDNVEFQYFPFAPSLSGIGGEIENFEQIIRNNILANANSDNLEENKFFMEDEVSKSLRSNTLEMNASRLSELLSVHNVMTVDLLKINIEEGADRVLAGIDDHNWESIKQVVIRVRDRGDAVSSIEQLLVDKGFGVAIEEAENFAYDNIKTLYAVKEIPEVIAEPKSLPKFNESGSWTDPELFKRSLIDDVTAILPEYMVPESWTLLAELPINQNGKVDKPALLSEITRVQPTEELCVSPENEIESSLLEIWKEVLQKENFGVTHNFFKIGGHSLKAVQVSTRVFEQLGFELDIKEVFEQPTVRELASILADKSEKKYESIPRLPEVENYEASHAQQRLWVLHSLQKEQTAYNQPRAYRISGEINLEALNRSFQHMIGRHESLRTVFRFEQGKLKQVVQPTCDLTQVLEIVDQADENLLNSSIAEACEHSFDLEKGPLLYAKVLKSSDHSYLILNSHHIICDGQSIEVFLTEWLTAYEQCNKHQEIVLPDLPIQYKDYAAWQNGQLSVDTVQSHRTYWMEQFKNDVPVLKLPVDRPRSGDFSRKGTNQILSLDEVDADKFQALAATHQVSPFIIFVSALKVLLHQYTQEEDITIGTPVNGRHHKDLEGQIGFFLNMLPLRSQVSGSRTLEEILLQEKATILDAFDHQIYPFDQMIKDLRLDRVQGSSPLFDVVLSYLDFRQEQKFDVNDLKIVGLETGDTETKYDLTFNVSFDGNKFNLSINFDQNLFDHSTISKLSQHYQSILKSLIDDTQTRVGEVSYLSNEEVEELLEVGRQRPEAFRDKDTIHKLWEDQVVQHSNRTAIVCQDRSVTFGEVNRRANQLAHWLLTNERFEAGNCVGLLVGRTEQMVIGMLGILKAGGAYLPLDPGFPEDRLKYMLEDSGVDLLVTGDVNHHTTHEVEVIDLKDDLLTGFSVSDPKIEVSSEQLAYIIYTSGSTGLPKGVKIKHQSVVNFIDQVSKTPGFSAEDRVLAATTISFDISIFDLICSLTNGAQAIVVSKEDREDPMLLANELNRSLPTMIHLTPSMWNMLLMSEWQGDDRVQAFSGGEPLTNDLATRIKERCGELWNFYGPTEATIYSSLKQVIDPKSNITVGKPLGNNAFFVLGQQDQLLPKGVPGELYIGGASLAEGYHNRPELTAERFVESSVPHPARLYKTGDIARWNETGELEILGRNDDQVKIRGHRVEIGEIENAITRLEGIRESAVGLRTLENNQSTLIAWLLTDKLVDTKEIKDQLRTFLPKHMVPDHLSVVSDFPRTNNGKINKRKLTFDQVSKGGTEVLLPRNETEERIYDLWKEVLGHQDFGVLDNFFLCGGHSLGAAHLNMLLQKEFQVETSLRDVFEHATIASLAFRVSQTSAAESIEIEQAPVADSYPVSHAQQRMWMLQSLDPDGTQYHIEGTFNLDGEVNVAQLEQAFQKLICRHEILRTNFDQFDGELRQIIQDPAELKFQVRYETHESEGHQQRFIAALTQTPYDLSTDTLLRVGLLKLESQRHVLVISMHHIIADDHSLKVIFKDLVDFYQHQNEDETLSPRIQYKDFSIWQKQQLTGDGLANLKSYWLKQFADPVPMLALPRESGTIPSGQGSQLDLVFNDLQKSTIESFSRQEEGTTLFMTLVSTINALLSYYTDASDIVLGMPVSGRNQHQLNDQVGCFVNTLPVRTRLDQKKSFAELLMLVRESMVGALDHQAYPYDQLLDDIREQTGETISNLFEVMVSFQDQAPDQEVDSTELLISSIHETDPKARFELSFNFWKQGDELGLSMIYDQAVFSDAIMESFLTHYMTLVDFISTNKNESLAELELLSSSEKEELLTLSKGDTFQYPENQTSLDLLEVQVAERPTATAIIQGDNNITYDKLNKLSDAFAKELITAGIQPGDHVGLSVRRSIEMIVAALGIMKSGAAYVPLDPDYTSGRIDHMVENSKLETVVIHARDQINTDHFPETLDIELGRLQEVSDTTFPRVNPEDTFAILYTSGSTGKPKGVVITHANVLARMHYLMHQYPFNSGDRTLFYRSYGFDASMEEFLYPLMVGGTCCVAAANIKEDLLNNISAFLRHHLVSKINMPPSMLKEIIQLESIDCFDSIRYVISGGEQLSIDLARDFTEKFGDILYNAYGPTENTDDSTVWKAHALENSAVSIGKPIENSSAYIVNAQGRLKPKGAHGELWVGGAGLSNGYLDLPDQTNERFVSNPFGSGKLYKTGDLGRWLPDGNIEFIGRNDEQIKVRGFRIELKEIEYALSRNGQVDLSTVQFFTSTLGVKEIVAFVVLNENGTLSRLIDDMGSVLPSYMLPARYFEISDLPKNTHGKVDKHKLREIYLGAQQQVSAEQLSAMELGLQKIWSDVLGITQIGKQDRFFDIGGHSINAFQVITRIHKVYGIKLALKDLFSRPTIEALASYLDGLKEEVYEAIPHAPVQAHYPLTHSQKRIWLQCQWNENLTAYNLPSTWELTGNFNHDLADKAFQLLIEKYEILRTNFRFVDEEPCQIIRESEDMVYKTLFEDLSEAEHEVKDEHIASLRNAASNYSFDLESDSLIQVHMLRLATDQYMVLMNIHHIIYDGWSEGILLREWNKIYEGLVQGKDADSESLAYQYKDYAHWQYDQVQQGRLDISKTFWSNTYSGDIPVLQLPLDHARPENKQFAAHKVQLQLSKEESRQLESLANKHETTLFTTLLSIYGTLLYKWSGNESMVIGTPVSGRDSMEFEDQIGLFLNSLPIMLTLDPERAFDQNLLSVSKSVTEMLSHQNYPLDLIMEDLDIEVAPGRSPLFDCGFTWQNAGNTGPVEVSDSQAWTDLEIRKLERKNDEVKTDCWLHGGQHPDGSIGFSFSFDKALFRKDTANNIAAQFQALISQICENSRRSLLEMSIETTPKTMKKQKRGSIDLSGFSTGPAIETKEKVLSKGFPVVITAVKSDMNLAQWLTEHKSEIEDKLSTTGAVLLRGFAVDHLDKFHEASSAIGDQPMNYMDQSSPRTGIGKSLYTSTDHPADQVIQMHSELSYSADWPMQILFHCQQNATVGGQTPISDNRIVMQNLSAGTLEKFDTYGVKYVRNLMTGIGLSWQEVYQTNDKAVVERYCAENGIELEWISDEHLRVSWNRPAFRHHPLNEEKIWFNHAFFFNAANLVSYIHEVIKDPWDMPSNTFYGDGSPIETNTIEELRNAYETAKVIFDWRKGDVLLLDNMMISHGRNAFEGDRKIFVAMNNPHSALALA